MGEQGSEFVFSPWVHPGVEAFYVGSPREPGNLGDEVNESREGSGLSFVSLTETPEDHPGRDR